MHQRELKLTIGVIHISTLNSFRYYWNLTQNLRGKRYSLSIIFFEIFKQQKGEYMGSILTGWLESMGRQMKPDPSTMQLNRETLERGLSQTVRDNDENFPPEWRLSHRGRSQAEEV